MALTDAPPPPRRRPAPPRTASFEEATRLLRTAALARAIDEPGAPQRITPLLQGRFAMLQRTVDLAADAAVRDAAHLLLTHGWTPAELHAFAAKRLASAPLSYLLDTLAASAQWSAHVPWLADLAQLRARVWWTIGEPHLRQWSQRHDRRRPDTLAVVVEILALLSYLPRTDAPLPGAPAAPTFTPGAVVQDGRIVGKIDALLARATGTSYPEEASACAGKAQELMMRYATVPASARTGPLSVSRRIAAAVAAELAGLVRRASSGFGARVETRAAIEGSRG